MAAVSPTTVGTPRGWLAALLRGVSQVMLVGSPWTGLLFTAALFVEDWRLGAFGLLGAACSTATAYWLGTGKDKLALGLDGYCGCLVGVAIAARIGAGTAPVLLTALASAFAVVVSEAGQRMLRGTGLTVLTAPFALIASVLVVALPRFERFPHSDAATAALPHPASGSTHLGITGVLDAFCDNIGQVFLLSHWYVGLIVLAGLVVASRKAAIAAAGASLLSVGAACAVGAPAAQIREGVYGYNAVLAAIALTVVFLLPTVWGVLYTALAVVTTVVLTAAALTLCAPVGGAPYTWPFVLVTWLFLAGEPALERVRRRGP